MGVAAEPMMSRGARDPRLAAQDRMLLAGYGPELKHRAIQFESIIGLRDWLHAVIGITVRVLQGVVDIGAVCVMMLYLSQVAFEEFNC